MINYPFNNIKKPYLKGVSLAFKYKNSPYGSRGCFLCFQWVFLLILPFICRLLSIKWAGYYTWLYLVRAFWLFLLYLNYTKLYILDILFCPYFSTFFIQKPFIHSSFSHFYIVIFLDISFC